MYNGRYGTVECLVCGKDIEPGSEEAVSLHDGEDISPVAHLFSWMCDSDCVEAYADNNESSYFEG
jgi:hypothetical protein